MLLDDKSTTKANQFTVVLITSKRDYYLSFENSIEMNNWLTGFSSIWKTPEMEPLYSQIYFNSVGETTTEYFSKGEFQDHLIRKKKSAQKPKLQPGEKTETKRKLLKTRNKNDSANASTFENLTNDLNMRNSQIQTLKHLMFDQMHEEITLRRNENGEYKVVPKDFSDPSRRSVSFGSNPQSNNDTTALSKKENPRIDSGHSKKQRFEFKVFFK